MPHRANAVPAAPRIRRYVEGDELYAAMLADIAAAGSEVRMESYIYASDEIGHAFASALIQRARAGCRVRLRVDALGSFDTLDASLARALVDGGVQLEWCRRWNWRHPLRIHRRNHRKLLVVDRSCCYLGGFNLHREASLRHYGELRWRDAHVRIEGALVAQAIMAFDEYGCRRRRTHWRQLRADAGYLVPNIGLRRRFLLHRWLKLRFGRARRRLWLTTPYFVPPSSIQRALVAAARRGVDVRVLVPRRADVRLAQWASRAAYSRLLAGGVHIHEYLPRMLHAKTALIDADWSMVGTANLDYRSLFINDELVLWSQLRTLNERLATDFLDDLAQAEEICERHWSRRFGLSWLAELIGWLARRWL
ncbi:MAG: cardiolipin synthase B [Xanthomonadales bacterium]|nr:putative cardiolipin synthase YwiE [Xanthomonadales bacterium]MCC6592541.1 cardiolipin synthase B [Xanthomonadales bacterium]